MEVSHFELLYKVQAPIGPGVVGAVDTALQGYFLEITNLEGVGYSYRLEFVATPPAPGKTERSLAGNTLVFIDTPGVNNLPGFLTGLFTDMRFFPSQGNIFVPSQTTALVAVLPSVFGVIPTVDSSPIPPASDTFEVRGFVQITLPALNGVPQASCPVKVLLTPQNRTTFYKRNVGTGPDVTIISAQTQATLLTANGGALMLLPPQPA